MDKEGRKAKTKRNDGHAYENAQLPENRANPHDHAGHKGEDTW